MNWYKIANPSRVNDLSEISEYIKSWKLHSSLNYSEEISNETCQDIANGIVALIESEFHGKV